MTSIFVSHSRDDPNIDFFHKAFSLSSVEGKYMEFEDISSPPWSTIKEHVMNSACTFVLLSEPLLRVDYRHTQNWVTFEVGLSCALNKHVWVFEPVDRSIEFPVPYCTHYLSYDPARVDLIKYLKDQINLYTISKLRMFLQFNPKLWKVCNNEDCGLLFSHMTDDETWPCPSCRTQYNKQDYRPLSTFWPLSHLRVL